MSDKEKYGPEIMDEVSARVTLNTLMQRLPTSLTRKDYEQLVRAMRSERVHFNIKEENKKVKKAGGVVDSEEEDGDDTD